MSEGSLRDTTFQLLRVRDAPLLLLGYGKVLIERSVTFIVLLATQSPFPLLLLLILLHCIVGIVLMEIELDASQEILLDLALFRSHFYY